MVREGGVLLRVQNLQEGRRGVAPKVGADLVHFVQDEHRVVGPGPADGLDDAAGHGPDVGAAVTPDLGFVPHPAQGEAHELAPQGPGDGAAQGGLAGARRPHEAQDRPLHVGLQFAHRQIFQDAFLHLFQVVVVLVQNFPGLVQIQVVVGGFAPGQIDEPFEEIADDLVIRRVRRGPLEAFQFPFRLLHGVGRQLRLLQPELQFVDLPGGVVAFPQLLLQGLDMFLEVIILLGLVHVALHLALDLLAQLQDFELAVDVGQNPVQALPYVNRFQQFLLLGLGNVEAAASDVGQHSWVAELPYQVPQLRGQIG